MCKISLKNEKKWDNLQKTRACKIKSLKKNNERVVKVYEGISIIVKDCKIERIRIKKKSGITIKCGGSCIIKLSSCYELLIWKS